jgi:hypothetical protein
MIGGFLARLADDRYVQMPADDLSDLSNRYALVGNAMIGGSSSTFLKHKPVKVSGIESVHCGPTVEPVTHIRRNTFFTRDADESWNETVIPAAMDRWGKPQHGCGNSACRQRKRRLLRLGGKLGLGASSSLASEPCR